MIEKDKWEAANRLAHLCTVDGHRVGIIIHPQVQVIIQECTELQCTLGRKELTGIFIRTQARTERRRRIIRTVGILTRLQMPTRHTVPTPRHLLKTTGTPVKTTDGTIEMTTETNENQDSDMAAASEDCRR